MKLQVTFDNDIYSPKVCKHNRNFHCTCGKVQMYFPKHLLFRTYRWNTMIPITQDLPWSNIHLQKLMKMDQSAKKEMEIREKKVDSVRFSFHALKPRIFQGKRRRKILRVIRHLRVSLRVLQRHSSTDFFRWKLMCLSLVMTALFFLWEPTLEKPAFLEGLITRTDPPWSGLSTVLNKSLRPCSNMRPGLVFSSLLPI